MLEEAALGSCRVALSSAAYLSFLEGLLGRLVALLQPCEGVVGRVLCWEHELRETPSRGETGLRSSHTQQQLRERVQGSGTPQKALLLQSNGERHVKGTASAPVLRAVPAPCLLPFPVLGKTETQRGKPSPLSCTHCADAQTQWHGTCRQTRQRCRVMKGWEEAR